MESISENKNNQLNLRWNGFTENIITSLEMLLNNQDFVDVTLVCEGGSIKAHRLVLSTCSSFFQRVFKENVCPHPVIVLKGIALSELETLLAFIYHGEARTCEENVPRLLEAAQFLEITGLTSAECSTQVCSEPTIPDEPMEKSNQIDNDFLLSGVHSTTQEFIDLFTEAEKVNPYTSQKCNDNEYRENQSEIIHVDIKQEEPFEEEMHNDSNDNQSQSVTSPTQMVSKASIEDKANNCSLRFNTNRGGVVDFSVQEMLVLQQQRKLAFYQPRPCPKCQRMYRDAATLRIHLSSMHQVLQHKISCSCGSVFHTKHDLYIHRQKDHKGVVC